jgi:hypothetical protein
MGLPDENSRQKWAVFWCAAVDQALLYFVEGKGAGPCRGGSRAFPYNKINASRRFAFR